MSSSGCVLVVDDHTDNREMLVDFLAFAGFEVIAAATGAEAIELAERHRPRVVLMDLALPAVDGFEATRRIKANPLLAQTVVIAVTAHAFPLTRRNALDAGCDGVLIKPYDLSRVAAEVHRLIHGSLVSEP